MNENELKIMKVTNISDFDFNGENGARFDGHDYLIKKGEFLRAPYGVALHLAKHLAQAILIRKAPIRDEKQVNGRGVDVALFNEENVKKLIDLIMSEDGMDEKLAAKKSEGELTKEKIAALNNSTSSDSNDADDSKIPETTTYKDKAEVIAALTEKGIPHDPKLPKAKLEELLGAK